MFSEHDIADLELKAVSELSSVPLADLQEGRLCLTFRDPGSSIRKLPNAAGAAHALIEFRNGNRNPALNWAKGFTIEFLAEIRKSLCARSRRSSEFRAGTTTAKGAVAAIASWLAGGFAVINPIAGALATFIIVVIGSAALSAFCKMTDEEVLYGLRNIGSDV